MKDTQARTSGTQGSAILAMIVGRPTTRAAPHTAGSDGLVRQPTSRAARGPQRKASLTR